MRWKSPSDSIFAYCLTLAFGSAILLAIASISIVMLSRPPFYFPYSTLEIARALEGKPVTRPGGLGDMSVAAQPGIAEPTDRYESIVRDTLARHLGVAPNDVAFEIVKGPLPIWNPASNVAREEYERVLGGDEALYREDPRFSAIVFDSFRAAVRQPDGQWRVLSQTRQSPGPQWQEPVARLIVLALALILPVAWWFSQRLTAPIRAFAAAADRVGRGAVEHVAIDRGPSEIRVAAAALNDMQARLEQQMRTRTAVVAAIAHDLRTPLARLAFLVEGAPEAVRAKTEAEISKMDRMIAVSLDFVRSETAAPMLEKVHLDVLAEAVVDDFADRGHDVRMIAATPAIVRGEPVLLTQILDNLVNNAVRYGGAARVSLQAGDTKAVIVVEDDGPGLAEVDLAHAFEPFFRAEASRNEATGGMGLGLTIAQSLARRHGGDVTLRNRAPHGLEARVTLPRVEI